MLDGACLPTVVSEQGLGRALRVRAGGLHAAPAVEADAAVGAAVALVPGAGVAAVHAALQTHAQDKPLASDNPGNPRTHAQADLGRWSSFIQRFYLKRFTALTDIHPFMHSFTQRCRSQPRRATASWSGAVRVRRLAQEHHDTQPGGAGDRTSNPAVTSQSALPPELMFPEPCKPKDRGTAPLRCVHTNTALYRVNVETAESGGICR